MAVILNLNPIPIRFILKEVSKKDWEGYTEGYQRFGGLKDYIGYYLVYRKKTLKGLEMGATILCKIADIGNWRESYLAEFGGYKCVVCEDTGVEHRTEGWISCSSCNLGKVIKQHYKNYEIKK